MKDCNFCYEKERFPQIKKENEQLKSELETYQILAHKRGECYLSSLREIKKQKEEKEQLKQQLENEKQLNAEIKKRFVEVEYDCTEYNHEYCDTNCNGKRKETIDLLQLVSDGLNETLLKQKDEENKQLAKRICELQSDLASAKSMIEKMKNCSNCNGIIKGGLGTERCKNCIKDTTFGYWELAE
jgi:hypothetical protein